MMSNSDDARALPEPPFDHFGVLAPLYERFIRPPDVGVLRGLCALRPDDRLLDVGGGTGRVSQYFRGDVARVCIVDVSAGMVREALAKGGFCAGLGVAERLPFRDGAFSRIIAVDSFHHCRHHAQAARELVRVLAPGGRLVIEEPDIRRFGVKLVALGETLTLMRSRFYRPAALMRFFAGPGLRVSLHEDDPAPTQWMPTQRTPLPPNAQAPARAAEPTRLVPTWRGTIAADDSGTQPIKPVQPPAPPASAPTTSTASSPSAPSGTG